MGGGGPAAHTGMAFQNRTAAWVAVQIFGEQAVLQEAHDPVVAALVDGMPDAMAGAAAN